MTNTAKLLHWWKKKKDFFCFCLINAALIFIFHRTVWRKKIYNHKVIDSPIWASRWSLGLHSRLMVWFCLCVSVWDRWATCPHGALASPNVPGISSSNLMSLHRNKKIDQWIHHQQTAFKFYFVTKVIQTGFLFLRKI